MTEWWASPWHFRLRRISGSHRLRSDVKARHDKTVGLVETMLKLHGDSSEENRHG
jgi:hypothetical protein